jgi:hypothetical protein
MNEGWSSSCCNNNTAILSDAEEQGKGSVTLALKKLLRHQTDTQTVVSLRTHH